MPAVVVVVVVVVATTAAATAMAVLLHEEEEEEEEEEVVVWGSSSAARAWWCATVTLARQSEKERNRSEFIDTMHPFFFGQLCATSMNGLDAHGIPAQPGRVGTRRDGDSHACRECCGDAVVDTVAGHHAGDLCSEEAGRRMARRGVQPAARSWRWWPPPTGGWAARGASGARLSSSLGCRGSRRQTAGRATSARATRKTTRYGRSTTCD